jgi:hypothetical protein
VEDRTDRRSLLLRVTGDIETEEVPKKAQPNWTLLSCHFHFPNGWVFRISFGQPTVIVMMMPLPNLGTSISDGQNMTKTVV